MSSASPNSRHGHRRRSFRQQPVYVMKVGSADRMRMSLPTEFEKFKEKVGDALDIGIDQVLLFWSGMRVESGEYSNLLRHSHRDQIQTVKVKLSAEANGSHTSKDEAYSDEDVEDDELMTDAENYLAWSGVALAFHGVEPSIEMIMHGSFSASVSIEVLQQPPDCFGHNDILLTHCLKIEDDPESRFHRPFYNWLIESKSGKRCKPHFKIHLLGDAKSNSSSSSSSKTRSKALSLKSVREKLRHCRNQLTLCQFFGRDMDDHILLGTPSSVEDNNSSELLNAYLVKKTELFDHASSLYWKNLEESSSEYKPFLLLDLEALVISCDNVKEEEKEDIEEIGRFGVKLSGKKGSVQMEARPGVAELLADISERFDVLFCTKEDSEFGIQILASMRLMFAERFPDKEWSDMLDKDKLFPNDSLVKERDLKAVHSFCHYPELRNMIVIVDVEKRSWLREYHDIVYCLQDTDDSIAICQEELEELWTSMFDAVSKKFKKSKNWALSVSQTDLKDFL